MSEDLKNIFRELLEAAEKSAYDAMIESIKERWNNFTQSARECFDIPEGSEVLKELDAVHSQAAKAEIDNIINAQAKGNLIIDKYKAEQLAQEMLKGITEKEQVKSSEISMH